MKIAKFAAVYRGHLFHLCGGILVFVLWRITGMPSPGTLGRLIPVAWITLGLFSARTGISQLARIFLVLFVLLALMWRIHPAVRVLASGSAILGLFPGIMATAASGVRWSLVRAALPLFFVTVLLVPFEGDEPHYAALTEELAGGTGEVFIDPGIQSGDLESGETHHTKAFPLLLLPGYPLGQVGVRTISFVLALASIAIMALLFKSYGLSLEGEPAWMALLLMPGAGLLGLLYPGWVCMGLFCFGAIWIIKGRWSLLVIAIVTILMTAIKFRFFVLGLGLLLVWLLRLSIPKKSRYVIGILGAGALLLAADYLVLGGNLFWNRYGNIEVIRVILTTVTRRTGLLLFAPLSSLLDIEAGLLWKAPWIVLSFAGLPALRRKHPELFLTLGLPSLLYIIVMFIWMPTGWHSLPTPPGRLFMPLIPLFLASASMVLQKRSAWILLWLSFMLSALCMADPWLRFNHADGTDSIVSLLTGGSLAVYSWLPSWVHPSLLPFLLWGTFSALLVWLVGRKGRGVQWALLAAFVAVGWPSHGYPAAWEAENLGPEMRTGCALYPTDPDPGIRNYWLFDRAPLLLIGHPSDRISLPVPPGADRVEVSITLRGMSSDAGSIPGIDMSCGDQSSLEYIDSTVRPMPGWVRTFKRGEDMNRLPENLADTTFVYTFSCTGHCIDISAVWSDGYAPPPAGVYIDRIEVSRE